MTNTESELELIHGPKLMEIVLQNCKGRVDDCVAPYLLLSANKLQNVERSRAKVALIGVVANALFYNSRLALEIMVQQGSLQSIMSKWFEMILSAKDNQKWKYFRRMQDKKVDLHALTLAIVRDGGCEHLCFLQYLATET